jgi:hypothetical protein
MHRASQPIREGAGAAGALVGELDALFFGFFARSLCLSLLRQVRNMAKSSAYCLYIFLDSRRGLDDEGIGSSTGLGLTCSPYTSSLRITDRCTFLDVF